MNKAAAHCVAIIALAITASTNGATTSFQQLGLLPGAHSSYANFVSADGTVIVGSSATYGTDPQPFRWTAGDGLIGLGGERVKNSLSNNTATGISADGTIIVGRHRKNNDTLLPQAVRWNMDNSMEVLWDFGSAYGVSANGAVVIGSLNPNSHQDKLAIRWTEAGGIERLDPQRGPWRSCKPTGISDDGSVIIGHGENDGSFQLFKWTSDEGMVGLGSNAENGLYTDNIISGDGSTIFGSNGQLSYRWTEADGFVDLGSALGSMGVDIEDCSADGSVVVGGYRPSYDHTDYRSFIWTEQTGFQDLQVVLGSLGFDTSDWSRFSARGISADGTTIVGRGMTHQDDFLNFYSNGWVATIPEPTSLAMLTLGGLGILRGRRRFGA